MASRFGFCVVTFFPRISRASFGFQISDLKHDLAPQHPLTCNLAHAIAPYQKLSSPPMPNWDFTAGCVMAPESCSSARLPGQEGMPA